VVHDSVPFPSLLEALRAAEAMIQEHLKITEQGYDAHIAELEARHNESVDYEESRTSAPSTAPVTCWTHLRTAIYVCPTSSASSWQFWRIVPLMQPSLGT
jgi:hypothetical protein